MGERTSEGAPMLWLTTEDVLARYKCSLSTLWRMRWRGDFPPPVRLAPRLFRWRLSDIEAFEARRAAEGAALAGDLAEASACNG